MIKAGSKIYDIYMCVILRTADKSSSIDVFIVCFRKSREFSTCLLRDDIPRRFYNDNGSRSLAHNDWVDMDVHR